MPVSSPALTEVELRGRRWDGPGTRTFVALHGLGVGSRLVAPLATHLRPHGTVIAPDLPGVGASADLADSDDEVTIDAHAHTVARWLRARDLREVVLIGVSVGTQVAIRAAAGDQKRRISHLVLLSPTVDPARRTTVGQLLRLPLEQSVNSMKFHRIALEDQAAVGAPRLLRLLRSAVADEPEENLPRIDIPTLVLRGTLDPLVSTRWAGHVAELTPRGTFQVLPGVRHAMSFEDASQAAASILSHLDIPVSEEP